MLDLTQPQFVKHAIFHPFEGFEDLRWKKAGKLSYTFIIIFFLLEFGFDGFFDDCLADFESYLSTYNRLLCDYSDKERWNRMSLENIAGAGIFAADRSIRDYAENIWKIKPIERKE